LAEPQDDVFDLPPTSGNYRAEGAASALLQIVTVTLPAVESLSLGSYPDSG
jgi:hypothetical protein